MLEFSVNHKLFGVVAWQLEGITIRNGNPMFLSLSKLARSIRFFSLIPLVFICGAAVAADKFSYSLENIAYATQDFDYDADTTGLALLYVNKDIDGDGDWDLVVATGIDRNLESRGPQPDMILLNQGDNTFMVADGETSTSEGPREGLVADFNGDGILDIFLADQGFDNEPFLGLRDSLLLGTDTGFTNATDTLPTINAFSHNAAAGDVDNDGDLDIFVMNNELGNLEEASYLLVNDGNANFELNRSRIPQNLVSFDPFETQSTFAVEFGDLDNDGWTDLIIGRRAEKDPQQPRLPSRVHWNNGDGTFSNDNVTYLPSLTLFDTEADAEVLEIVTHDFDSDGDLDLLLTNVDVIDQYGGRGFQLLINQGNRIFSDETIKRLGNVAQNAADGTNVPQFINIVDVNNDGIDDILPQFSEETSDDSPVIWEGTGYGCFNPITMADIANDQSERDLLAFGVPVLSEAGVSYVTTQASKENGNDVIRINQTGDLSISPLPKIANEYDTCSGYLRTNLDAGEFGYAALDFSIYQTEPTVVIQALVDSVATLTELPDSPATFNTSTGVLLIPELVLDDAVAYTNVEFTLIDAGQLLFQLTGSD